MVKKKTNSGAGPGKKNCPGCGEYIGARSKVCPLCSYNYETKAKEPPKPVWDVRPKNVITSDAWPNSLGIEANNITRYKVLLPSGKCPVDIKDFTPIKLKRWANEVSDIMAEKGQLMTPEALYYFAKKFNPDKEQIKVIQKILGVN